MGASQLCPWIQNHNGHVRWEASGSIRFAVTAWGGRLWIWNCTHWKENPFTFSQHLPCPIAAGTTDGAVPSLLERQTYWTTICIVAIPPGDCLQSQVWEALSQQNLNTLMLLSCILLLKNVLLLFFLLCLPRLPWIYCFKIVFLSLIYTPHSIHFSLSPSLLSFFFLFGQFSYSLLFSYFNFFLPLFLLTNI